MNDIKDIHEIKRIDFHSHILPGIDDGAANIEMSLKLLNMLKADGVDVVVATPHLYLHRETAEEFIEKRRISAENLKEAVSGKDLPEIVLGAEVYFSPALSEMPSDILKKLCVENTDYLLLELPYQNFSSSFLNLLSDFINYSSCKTILAHIERYPEFFSGSDLNELLSNGVLAQFNCDSLEKSSDRRKTLKLIKNGFIQIMGTDAHHAEKRPPLFGDAEKIIRKKLSDGDFIRMMKTAELILYNENVI